MARHVIIVHGGVWCNNIYQGGSKDYIPMPVSGISYVDLLSKVEFRLMKDTSLYTFHIDALVDDDKGEFMRMKVTDEFEWSTLLDMMELPVLYVNVSPNLIQSIPMPIDESLAVDVRGFDGLNTSCKSITLFKRASNDVMNAGSCKRALTVQDAITTRVSSIDPGQLKCGSFFKSKDSMVSAIHAYHLKNYVEFRTKISDSGRYHVQCKYQLTCVFSLRSKSFGRAWRIYEFVGHTCENSLGAAPKVSSRSIAEYVAPSMTEDGFVVRPRDIQGQLLRDLGVRLKYSTALSGKNLALKTIYGDHKKSFQMVASYLYMLEQKNPGSVVDLQTCDDLAFQYCYFALAASIRAFRACRPVIVIDATHLKGSYRGVLFFASTKDANEQIVPLAFSVGDKENDASWIWFLDHVRKSFGTPQNLLIVSDHYRSIKNAVEFVYPCKNSIYSGTKYYCIPHGLCTYHIQGNLRTFGDGVIDIFQAAANAYKEEVFQEHMDNLELSFPGAYAKLMAIGPERWASCKCPVRRYAFGTSNAVESLNGRLKWARKLPITALLEYASNLTQEWFYERRGKTVDRSIEVSEYAQKRLGFSVAKGNSMRVQPISDLIFNIVSGDDRNVVDIGKRECSCKVFQMDLLPCSHAAAALRYKNQNPISCVSAYYSTNTWREIYSGLIMPVPDVKDWHIPELIESRVVGTPVNPKQAGRPKTNRIPSGAIIKKRARVCSRCHQVGHYSSSCIASIPVTEEDVLSCRKTQAKCPRNPKKCGICGISGHTRQTCQDPNRF